ncbi:MAG: hypothetical protein A2Z28_01845 [Chloroflexi bacterium RBG_16_51_9]|nr:MAG: hypothetical protein A2Z28_01845 [Chloroflexi bacterium RBG_16_51_9]
MTNEPVINVVATQCKPEDEEKFNKWYNEVHIPMIMKFKGVSEVTRYKLPKDSEEYPKYLAIYTFDNADAFKAFGTCPEMAAVQAEMKETWKDGMFTIKWRVQYETIQNWKR